MNEDELLVGSVIDDRYDVADVIGQGSTGTVFGVRHVQFPRPFAMKVLRGRYASMDTVQSVWSGEASAAWSVTHPCLVEVFDAGILPEGAPWYLMERLEGETLAARLRRERLSMAASIDVVMQILAALDTIHARGLVMHDLRPQNIFLAQRMGCRPLLKILDFGLSRLVPLDRIQEEWDSLRSITGESDGNGTLAIPHYLSPERARGEAEIGAASDLFTCGTILYELLSGQRPFVSSSFNGLLLQISEANVTPLSELRSDIAPDVEEVVNLALSADPGRRPRSAREMQDALRAAFERPHAPSGRTSTAMPASSVDSQSPTGRHRRAPHVPHVPHAPMPVVAVPAPPTLRPPEIPIDVDDGEEPNTSRGVMVDLSPAEILARMNEEEETRTVKLSPELRAQIAMMSGEAGRQPEGRVEGMKNDSVPPPTRRDTVKPPR